MNDHTPFSPHRNFADNLRALCTRHGSIAAVCRKLGMNRQQFNKYLAGSTLPNAATLEKICAFFGIESEMLFQDPMGHRAALPRSAAAGLPESIAALFGRAFSRMGQATMRAGCYHFYYPWPRDPAKCIRAAVFVQRKDGATLFARFTKFRVLGQRQRYYLSGRHDGVVLESDRATFMLALNRKGFGEVSLVSMGAENALAQDFLSGLALVMGPQGTPMALRATLEYRGSASLLRRTIAEAGILPLADASIPEEVRQSISGLRQAGVPQLEPFSLLDSLPDGLLD